jgi:hypothetical protein
MYLAIMLIIIALLVFYNEINTKMNIAEYILLALALIAIIKASVNYINIDNISEGFTSQNAKYSNNNNNKTKNKKYNNNNYNNNNDDNDDNDNGDDENIIMISNDDDEYLDSDEIPNTINMNKNSFNSIDNAKVENKKSNSAINEINALLGINNVSQFANIPVPTSTEYTENEIKSSFNPQVIIGKGNKSNNDSNDNDKYNSVGKTGFGSTGNSSKWNSAFANDGFKFNNTMYPDVNLWRDEHGYYNGGYNGSQNNDRQSNDCQNNSTRQNPNTVHKGISGDQWTQSMDDYNKGKWQRNFYNRPSDYVDYTSPSGYGTTTPDNFNDLSNTSNSSNSSKKCGEYDDLSEDQSGNLVVKDYTQAKKWVAGYTYVPPVNWDVPQRHAPVCKSVTPNVQKLTGRMDRGLPINALELNPDGKIADTEDTVKLSNIGSMIPKFNYQEEPFSKPYA